MYQTPMAEVLSTAQRQGREVRDKWKASNRQIPWSSQLSARPGAGWLSIFLLLPGHATRRGKTRTRIISR